MKWFFFVCLKNTFPHFKKCLFGNTIITAAISFFLFLVLFSAQNITISWCKLDFDNITHI